MIWDEWIYFCRSFVNSERQGGSTPPHPTGSQASGRFKISVYAGLILYLNYPSARCASIVQFRPEWLQGRPIRPPDTLPNGKFLANFEEKLLVRKITTKR